MNVEIEREIAKLEKMIDRRRGFLRSCYNLDIQRQHEAVIAELQVELDKLTK